MCFMKLLSMQLSALKFNIYSDALNITPPWVLKELRTGMTEFEPHHWHSFFSFSRTPPVPLSYSSHPPLPSYVQFVVRVFSREQSGCRLNVTVIYTQCLFLKSLELYLQARIA
jgi:hypothetical protein